ncbi:MAG: hypothetical protein RL277_1434 [Planctomycetota bacterium]|jgi:hypothetical protein
MSFAGRPPSGMGRSSRETHPESPPQLRLDSSLPLRYIPSFSKTLFHQP